MALRIKNKAEKEKLIEDIDTLAQNTGNVALMVVASIMADRIIECQSGKYQYFGVLTKEEMEIFFKGIYKGALWFNEMCETDRKI